MAQDHHHHAPANYNNAFSVALNLPVDLEIWFSIHSLEP